MFHEIDDYQAPKQGSQIESNHFSSVLYEGNGGIFFVETISLRRGVDRRLNHTAVKRTSTYTDDMSGAQIAQSHWLIGLEEAVKGGKTAKQALIDASKPTSELIVESKILFDRYM